MASKTIGFCWLFAASQPTLRRRSGHGSAVMEALVLFSGRQIDAAGRFPVEKPARVDYGRAVIPCFLEFDWRASTKDG